MNKNSYRRHFVRQALANPRFHCFEKSVTKRFSLPDRATRCWFVGTDARKLCHLKVSLHDNVTLVSTITAGFAIASTWIAAASPA
jgi:hypothetical protein